MSHVSVEVIALSFMTSSLLPEELYTFAKMIRVCIKVNFIKLDKVEQKLFVSFGNTHTCEDESS